MSQARLYFTKKSRKVWNCSSCHEDIPLGSPVISFAVGFRGWEQKRCSKPGCYPKPSERESSLVSAVYAAQESADVETAGSLDDLYTIRDEIADACDEVADEYESNEMYDINYDLQERAETIRNAGDALRDWEPETDEPEQDEDTEDDDDPDNQESFLDWLEEAKSSLQDAINEMELP